MRSIPVWAMVVLTVSCSFAGLSAVEAGTRTYGFTGSITDIDNLNGSSLNSSLAVGTSYTVTYTFDDAIPSSGTGYGVYDYNLDAATAGRSFNMTLEVGNYSFGSVSGSYGNAGSIIITDNLGYPWYDTYQVFGQGFSASQGLSLYEIGGGVTGAINTHSGVAASFLPKNVSAYAGVAGFIARTADYDLSDPATGLALYGNLTNFFADFQTGNTYTHQVGPTFDVQCESNDDYDDVFTEGGATIDTYFTGDPFTYREGYMEFDLGHIPAGAQVTSAKLTLDIDSLTHGAVEYPVIDVRGYAGDGVSDQSDVSASKTYLGRREIRSDGLVDITLDTAYIASLIGDASHLGLVARPNNRDYSASFLTSEAFPYYGSAPMLTIDFIVSDVVHIPGDANGDGKVDVGDLGILAGNYGQSFDPSVDAWIKGDFNGDHKVDVGDLGILAGNYGYVSGAANVPEPMTLVLLTLGGLLLRRRG